MMNHSEAMARAQVLWNGKGSITVGRNEQKGNQYHVAVRDPARDYKNIIYGEGASFEEAFANAKEVNPK